LLRTAALVALATAAAASSAAAQATIGHIRIVTDLGTLPAEYRHSAYADETNPLVEALVTPNAATRAKLRAAVDHLPPILRNSIASIAIGRYAGGGAAGDTQVRGDTYGNNLILNAALLSDQAALNDVVAHESVHCFQSLVDLGHDIDTGNLPADMTSPLEHARQQRRTSSIGRILRRLQTTAAIADDTYRDYAGEAWTTRYTSDADAAVDGFATAYASEEPREDLAEMVALFVAGRAASHPYCTQFEGLDGEIPGQQALAFAKLNFARALGLITRDQYKGCVGKADPADAAIISMGTREYSGDLRHGTQTVRNPKLDAARVMWRIRGKAEDAQLEIRLHIRKETEMPVGSPIGFYRLDTDGRHGFGADQFTPIAAQSVITFQRTDARNPTERAAYTRISGGGYVLITDFSADFVKGYAFDVPFYPILELEPRATDTMKTIWFLWER
jgi:hypothetical protein